MIPTSILIDTTEAVKKLRDLPHTESDTVWRLFITYLLADLVDALRVSKTAMADLLSFCKEIEKGKYKQYFKQRELLSDTVYASGKMIYVELVRMMAYDPDGILRYYYYPVNLPNFNDLLLVREQELPAPKETP